MKIYQTLRKTVFGIIVASLLWSGAISVSAEESINTYTVKIPKNITLDEKGNYNGTFLTASGNIDFKYALYTTINDSITLSTTGKPVVFRNITLNSNYISGKDLVSESGITGSISGGISNLSAGGWGGKLEIGVYVDKYIEIAPGNEIDKWQYQIDEASNKVYLVKYIGTDSDVIVYGKYNINGRIYNADISTTDRNYYGPFYYNKTVVKTVKFNYGVYCDSLYNTFYSCNNITNIDFTEFDTSNVTSMLNTFYGCNSLTTLDVSNFDTSKVTNMQNMFGNCKSLTTLDVRKFDTSKVTNMVSMFNYCSKLTTLDLSSFDTSKVTDMNNMFYGDSGTVYVATADIKATMESKFTNMTFVVKNNKMSSASVLSAPTLSTTVSDGNADVANDTPIINEEETIKDSVSSGDAETSTSDEIISDNAKDTLSDDDWMQLALSVSDGNAAPGDREKCEEKLTEMQESGITPEISELMKILIQIIVSVILPRYRWY